MLRIAQAELAEADGDPDGAQAAFAEALTVIAPAVFGYFTILTRIAYAGFLMRASKFHEARRQLSLARDFFADPLAYRQRDEIDALLKRCEVGV